ncbi:coiled-coil-helix-coiled-coil-helix domain-containing protein 1 [Nematolebias whitei]|uniref:coiled-coil-helix-coiled-coil-helix domain-containing protein 1 n=1 Tax=Nematolebias whitei TaxID=451745 RepID=UPI001898723A|nr:coiled-coil-helix-coiled-coil-helix domain-containing protein 1 [Nematolebias whitei]
MANGTIQFQEKVNRMLSKEHGKPVLRPNKMLALKDTVGNRKLKQGGATCVAEMYVLMACWKQNNFVDSLCFSEVDTFYACVKKAQAAQSNKSEVMNNPGGRLTPKQATSLLKRFPNPRKEI